LVSFDLLFLLSPKKIIFFATFFRKEAYLHLKLNWRIKMTEFLKVAVTLIIAVPFIYMFYDVTVDLFTKLYTLISRKAKPVLVSILSIFSS